MYSDCYEYQTGGFTRIFTEVQCAIFILLFHQLHIHVTKKDLLI